MNKQRIVQSLRKKIGRDRPSGQITQNELSKKTGVHQSQISRFLSGDFVRPTQSLKIICEELKIPWVKTGNKKSVKGNKTLMDSLQRAWDGSDRHADVIAKLLDSVAETNSYLVEGKY